VFLCFLHLSVSWDRECCPPNKVCSMDLSVSWDRDGVAFRIIRCKRSLFVISWCDLTMESYDPWWRPE